MLAMTDYSMPEPRCDSIKIIIDLESTTWRLCSHFLQHALKRINRDHFITAARRTWGEHLPTPIALELHLRQAYGNTTKVCDSVGMVNACLIDSLSCRFEAMYGHHSPIHEKYDECRCIAWEYDLCMCCAQTSPSLNHLLKFFCLQA